ncbi:MAG: hypothetical protein HY878_00315 [Deltaproteobacteria bacterium]|nr:hypothetical protein [Deltaproteobacteria bacterium]
MIEQGMEKETPKDREGCKIEINTPDVGYEPFPVSILNRSTHEVMTFDPTLGKPATISYSLNKSGCIRVRLVCRNQQNLVIRTLQDWTDQGFGRYELKWDGRDVSGNIVDNKRILVVFEAKDHCKHRHHLGHDIEVCRDQMLIIESKQDTQKVKGIFKMRALLPPGTNGFGKRDGVEVRYFVDYKPFKTERFEKGTGRFGFKIDTRSLENGEHLITVNIDDLDDHIGTAGVKVDVEN